MLRCPAFLRILVFVLLLSLAASSVLPGQDLPLAGLGNRVQELSSAGKYIEAIPLQERILQIGEQAFGPKSSKLFNTISYLADLCERSGNFARAETLLLRAISSREEEFGSTI